MGVIALAVGLVVSLVMNLTLWVLYDEQRDRADDLALQVDQLRREIDDRPAGSDVGVEDIAAAVERLRGRSFTDPVEPEVLSSEALSERVRSLFLEDNPREEFEDLSRVLETLGVMEPGAGLFDLFVEAYEEQVLGYYDQNEQVLVVSGDSAADPSPFTRIILAHELTHALTDQHFDLSRLDRLRDRGKDDAAAAYLALVEGDATLLMTEYLLTELTAGEQAAVGVEQGNFSTTAFDRMPPFLQQTQLFPYIDGLTFVRALHARGGFELIDRAYRDPPTSTEQILHPERYLDRRDEPEAVDLPDVRRALGASWRRLIDGEVGELDLRLIADLQVASGGLSERDARTAADGWDGGSYAAFSSDRGTLVAIQTVWDSVDEAREAVDGFTRWLPLRYGNLGAPLDVGDGSGRGWVSNAGDAGMVLRSGDQVIILLGPDEASVRDARGAFRGF